MKPCPSEEEILGFVEGALEATLSAAFCDHVAECAACSELVASLGRASGLEQGPSPADESVDSGRVGRFLLKEPIGAGGMGIVYRAYDPELQRELAVKLLLPHVATGDGLSSLQQEARTMARLSHPNVVAVYDVGVERERVFLAMELVFGVTLARWLEATPRSWREVLEKFAAAGEGLVAAHAAGVIHGDFKPDNVLVADDGRVRVTDFGLARAAPPPDESAPVLRDDGAAHGGDDVAGRTRGGTPAYMAPEVLRGRERASERSDLFAFCVALHEALYGVRPFAGRTAHEVLASAERGAMTLPPSDKRVPSWLRSALEQGLRAAPEERPSSMRALLDQLARGERRARVGRWAAVTLVVVAAACAVAMLVKKRAAVLETPLAARPAVAVIALADDDADPRNDDSAWLPLLLTQLLEADLAAGDKLRVVTDDNFVGVIFVPASQSAAELDTAALHRARESSGADYVVFGAFHHRPGEDAVSVELRLQGTGRGEVILEHVESGSASALDAVARRSAAALRKTLRIEPPTEAELAEARARVPSRSDAAELYARGIERLRAFDVVRADAFLARAVELEDASPYAHFARARSAGTLGYAEVCRDEAKKALERSSGLSRRDRLAIEALYREKANELDRAIEIAGALFTFYPDDVGMGIYLANLQINAGKAREALATVDALHALPPPAGRDPRISIAEAKAAHASGDPARAVKAAESAEARGEELGLRRVVARAHDEHGVALGELGDDDAAIRQLREAEKELREIGDRAAVAHALMNMGNVLAEQGRLDEASAAYDEALAVGRECGAEDMIKAPLEGLSVVAARRGDYRTAARDIAEAAEHARRIGTKNRVAEPLINGAIFQMALGNLASARADAERAVLLSADSDRLGAGARDVVAEVAFWQGDEDVALASYREALRMHQAARRRNSVALSSAGLALVECNRGHAADALALLDQAAAQIDEKAPADVRATLAARRAMALLLVGRRAEAREAALVASRLLATEGVDLDTRSHEGPDVARVLGATGTAAERDAQMRELAAQVATMRDTGALLFESSYALALAELEVLAGAKDARAHLDAVAAEARTRGFLPIVTAAKVPLPR